MDIRELHDLGNELLDLVRSRVDAPDWDGAHSLLNHGEEEEFADLLLAMLANDAVPLSPGEHATLTRLVAGFPTAEYDRDHYRYLADPQVLDRMNVVDESS